MAVSQLPHRSVLYMPGSNARALEKARQLDVDAVILDLEDAVAPDAKELAREQVTEAVKAGGFGYRRVAIRVNGADTEWGAADLDAAISAKPDAILLPKVESAETVQKLAARLDDAPETRIWAMMETPLAMLKALEIAKSSPRLEAFVLGTNDLLKDLHAQFRPDRLALMPGLGLSLLAAKAAGILCLDGVYNAFKDEEGLRIECEQGRDLGFDGKTLIHPAQVSVTHEVFSPDAEDVAEAEAMVQAFEEAGGGIAVLNGRIVENLHVEAAQRLLKRAGAIAAR
ncbi:HpcH/HpaI aldolase/citrate lyase family protein [Algicella marina]|uniref:CoA ester lyase n=1 Tax=Algicella marina TaxID=2683284 RepID=A0A6P1T0K7_9RHOB|nr:CoA ester lyase [Algicella marina]QHQ36268.1 CoA ester lyase [Algicella marina]